MQPHNGKEGVTGSYQTAVQVVDLATGKMLRETLVSFVGRTEELAWTSDSHLLIGHETAVDVAKQVPLWRYHGAEQLQVVNGICWFWLKEHDTEGFVPLQLPHALAKEQVTKYVAPPVEYLMKPGAKIAMNLTGIGDADQIQAAETAYKAQLKANGYTVDPSGEFQLTAVVEAGKTEEVTYRNFGGLPGRGEETYCFTPMISKLSIEYEGKSIWGTGGAGGIRRRDSFA